MSQFTVTRTTGSPSTSASQPNLRPATWPGSMTPIGDSIGAVATAISCDERTFGSARNPTLSTTILTAWNPLGRNLPEAENRRAQETLLSAIRARGLRWLNATGEDPTGSWEPEPGFCVLDVPDAVLDDWLVIFRQNAAVRAARDEPCRLVWHPAIRELPGTAS